MKLLKLVLVTSLAMSAFSANAFTLTVKEGNYEEGTYLPYMGESKGQFELRQKGAQIRLVDTKNQITYALDLNNAGEQQLPAKYLAFQQNNTLIGPIRSTLENFSVKILRQGKTQNELEGVAYVYQKINFAGADVRIKWAFEVNVVSKQKTYQKYDNGGQIEVERPAVNVKSKKIYIANLQTVAPDAMDRYFAGIFTKVLYYLTASLPIIDTELHGTK